MTAYDTEFVDRLEAPDNLEEDLIKNESMKELGQAMALLSEEELELISMVYYNGMPLIKYAENKNFNYQKVVRRRRRILDKLGIYLRK